MRLSGASLPLTWLRGSLGSKYPTLTPASPKFHCRSRGHFPLAKPTWKPEASLEQGREGREGAQREKCGVYIDVQAPGLGA